MPEIHEIILISLNQDNCLDLDKDRRSLSLLTQISRESREFERILSISIKIREEIIEIEDFDKIS